MIGACGNLVYKLKQHSQVVRLNPAHPDSGGAKEKLTFFADVQSDSLVLVLVHMYIATK